jgi:large subunit ribosomal protein L4
MADAKAKWLGKQGGVALDAEAFGARFNEGLVHECVRAELNARRQGTASTRTRGLVRGGGTKPWRQKGTGRARAGSIRSPLWTGGGTVFGPEPRRYTVKVNRKARRAALRSALSLHAGRGSIAAVDASAFDGPSTHQAADALAKWDQPGAVLVALADDEVAAAKSFRNLARVSVLPASEVGVADLVAAGSLVVSPAALEALTARAKGERPEAGSDAKEEAAV